MALVNVIAPPPPRVELGENHFSGIFAGYITGSGNYIDFFIPCDYDSAITSVSISINANSNFVAYMSTTYYNAGGMSLANSSVQKCKNGLLIEIKFTSTQTANRVANMLVSSEATFTFS